MLTRLGGESYSFDSSAAVSLAERASISTTESIKILSAAKNRETARIESWAADCHPVFRAKVHAGNVDEVQQAVRMFSVVALDGPFQLSECMQVMIMLQLLLAIAAGENELACPGRRVAFRCSCHGSRFDANRDNTARCRFAIAVRG